MATRPHIQFVRLCARAAAIALAALLSACATRQAPDPARDLAAATSQADEITWPTRDANAVDQRIWMRPGKQRLYVAGLDDLRGHVRPYIWSGDVQVLDRRHAGLGLLCEVQRADQPREWYDPRVFMFYTSQTPVMCADRTPGPPSPAYEEIDGTPMDGVIFRLRPDPRGVKAERGVVLALRPLSGATYTRSTINELRDRGWVVIESSLGFGVAGVGDQRDAKTDADLDRFGTRIGELLNERLSEWSYGCEAMVQMVRRERPNLIDKPVLVVGFSAGAIGAPTVAARLGEQVKGIVLVGGGVDVSRIAQTSALSDFGLGVSYNGQRVTGEKLDRLSTAYLKAATLDSFHTASTLRHTPALMLQALADDIVPVQTGQTLYERMGKPERWLFDGGHEMLFLQLGWFDTKIADWVDGHVGTQAMPARTVTAR